MAAEKTPVLMVLGVRTEQQQWFIAEVSFHGRVTPLLRSEPGNLQEHSGQAFDDQVSFLRHRLAGALQRGCDRLWGRTCKASHIVILTDGDFDPADPGLTGAVADHFHLWMTRPPVIFLQLPEFAADIPLSEHPPLAGELDADVEAALRTTLPAVIDAMDSAEQWEVVTRPRAS